MLKLLPSLNAIIYSLLKKKDKRLLQSWHRSEGVQLKSDFQSVNIKKQKIQ